MSRRKIANLERDLSIAESDYREQLIAALRRTAAGHWGLLGANQQLESADRAMAIKLLEAGKRIAEIRAQLGVTERFDLHERFISARRTYRENNAMGEPKFAERLLSELDTEDAL